MFHNWHFNLINRSFSKVGLLYKIILILEKLTVDLTWHRLFQAGPPRTHWGPGNGWRLAVPEGWADGHLWSPPPISHASRSGTGRLQHTRIAWSFGHLVWSDTAGPGSHWGWLLPLPHCCYLQCQHHITTSLLPHHPVTTSPCYHTILLNHPVILAPYPVIWPLPTHPVPACCPVSNSPSPCYLLALFQPHPATTLPAYFCHVSADTSYSQAFIPVSRITWLLHNLDRFFFHNDPWFFRFFSGLEKIGSKELSKASFSMVTKNTNDVRKLKSLCSL